LAGITEVVLKKIIMDKTNWRKMLTNDIEVADLVAELKCNLLPGRGSGIFYNDVRFMYQMHYPVLQYTKVKV
jgi:hypothetical protein